MRDGKPPVNGDTCAGFPVAAVTVKRGRVDISSGISPVALHGAMRTEIQYMEKTRSGIDRF